MRIRKPLGVLAVLTAATLAFSGCAATASSTESSSGSIPELKPDQKVSIVFETYNLLQAGPWTDTVNSLVADFMAEHPNITVTAQPTQGDSGNTVGSVQTQMLAGAAPDVAQITFDALDFTVNELGAQPLEKLVGTEAIEEHFGGDYPFHERAATLADWDGVTYGIPYVFSTPVLFYNATALQAAGVPADADLSTWDAVADVARTVTAKTGKPALTMSCAVKGGNWCMQGLIRSNGGSVLSDDRSTIEFGEKNAVGAVQELRDLFDEGVLANQDATAQFESFARGDSVMQLQTSALQGMFMGAAKAGGWELKNTGMPAFGDKPVVPTNSGSALFTFSTDPAKQRASWEFISYMTSAHAYEKISSTIGYLPLRTTMTEGDGPLADWAAGNPLVAPNLAQLDHLEPWVSYPGNSYVQVDDILATAVEESVFYGKDPAKTLGAAQDRAQELISK
ncbi:extracellular solute-binding protein [Leifsonia sp. YAF41]|uniref:extracellular solute-binding protein n=1 Tax=Leifsonia sp. YAF41 TaxID=3233086 RepID=UPI003F9623A1